jgi:sodium pump decarboxylase gamma subunit
MDWSLVFSTAATGLGVVFVILLFLIGLLTLTGWILSPKSKRKTLPKPQFMPVKKSFKLIIQPKATPAPVQAPPQIKTDELQVIAVITAAIAAYSAQGGKPLRIVDIKKVRGTGVNAAANTRSAWGNAGVSESMR